MLAGIGAVEHARDEISLWGNVPVTDRANAFKGWFKVGMAMRTTKDMAHSILFTGKDSGLQLLRARKCGST